MTAHNELLGVGGPRPDTRGGRCDHIGSAASRKRREITVTSDAARLDPQSADAQLAALASLLSRATGTVRVVPLDWKPITDAPSAPIEDVQP